MTNSAHLNFSIKTLTIDSIDYPLDTNKNLLENIEATTVPIEFHCRDGHCGACRCSLISGSVEYKKHPMAYLRENEVLPCCSISKEDIQISII